MFSSCGIEQRFIPKWRTRMKKTNVVGMMSIISGSILWGYKSLSNFMGGSTNLQTYNQMEGFEDHITLYESLPEGNFDWVDSIPWSSVHSAVDYVVNMPLWLLLVIVGGVMLIIGGLFIKK
jgi:hypothetical protein